MINKKAKTTLIAALSFFILLTVTITGCDESDKTEVKTENVVAPDTTTPAIDTTIFTDSADTRPVKTPD